MNGKIMRIFPGVLFLSLLCVSACTNKVDPNTQTQTEELYIQSKQLLIQYIDSMKSASDSLTSERLLDAYRDKLDSITFEYPKETDLQFTEGENDTLMILTNQLLHIHEKKLKEVKTDTIN